MLVTTIPFLLYFGTPVLNSYSLRYHPVGQAESASQIMDIYCILRN